MRGIVLPTVGTICGFAELLQVAGGQCRAAEKWIFWGSDYKNSFTGNAKGLLKGREKDGKDL